MEKMARRWLIAVLVFLPFQLMLDDAVNFLSSRPVNVLRYIDEITIVLAFPMAVYHYFKNTASLTRFHLYIMSAILSVLISGAVSAIVNGTPFLIGALGIFDYIKNFLVIFIYAAFFSRDDDFNRLFKYPLYTAVLIGIVAILQESWALTMHYVLGYSIDEDNLYVLRLLPQGEYWGYADLWRLGIYRAPSLMFHPNNLGIYGLLILTLYLFTFRTIAPLYFVALLSNVLFSVSRMAYSALTMMAGLQFLWGRRWLAIVIVPVVMLLFLMSTFPDMSLVQREEDAPSIETGEGRPLVEKQSEDLIFRKYAKNKALEVWRDYPLLGAGPGMFGGVISMTFDSPLYQEYEFSRMWLDYMRKFRSLDQFWPQILAEMGALGAISFGCLLLMLIFVFFSVHKRAPSENLRNLFSGLVMSTIFVIIYSFGSGLNNTAFLFTLSALAGIGISNCESAASK